MLLELEESFEASNIKHQQRLYDILLSRIVNFFLDKSSIDTFELIYICPEECLKRKDRFISTNIDKLDYGFNTHINVIFPYKSDNLLSLVGNTQIVSKISRLFDDNIFKMFNLSSHSGREVIILLKSENNFTAENFSVILNDLLEIDKDLKFEDFNTTFNDFITLESYRTKNSVVGLSFESDELKILFEEAKNKLLTNDIIFENLNTKKREIENVKKRLEEMEDSYKKSYEALSDEQKLLYEIKDI